MTYQQNSFRALYLILIGLVLSFHTFVLAADSPSAVPTFNDRFTDAAPDIGAQETDAPPLEFDPNAYK